MAPKECGRCHCNDIEPFGEVRRAGKQRYQRWRCNWCGGYTSEALDPAPRPEIEHEPGFSTRKPACPCCGAPTVVYRTMRHKRVRYLRCTRHPNNPAHRTKQAAE